VARVRAEATFTVEEFTPVEVTEASPIATALPVGVATMIKAYTGQIEGRTNVIFTSAFDPSIGVGTYVALESFEGTVDQRRGSFNFVHSASTGGTDRTDQFFLIVPRSGTHELATIRGSGGLTIDDDGTHRFWLDYEISTT